MFAQIVLTFVYAKGVMANVNPNKLKSSSMEAFELSMMDCLSHTEFGSWLKIQQAYMQYAWKESVIDCGHIIPTGYVYIRLENGVVIASSFNQEVEYYNSLDALFDSSDEEPCTDYYEMYNSCYRLKLAEEN